MKYSHLTKTVHLNNCKRNNEKELASLRMNLSNLQLKYTNDTEK